MTRPPDPKSKTTGIFISARNDEEKELVRKFKGVCRKDNYEYMDVFLPIIQAKVRADNPQLHFRPIGNQLVLSKKIPDASRGDLNPRVTKVTCLKCGGEGCQHCRFDGWVTEEAVP